jgi:hypothetical protein
MNNEKNFSKQNKKNNQYTTVIAVYFHEKGFACFLES